MRVERRTIKDREEWKRWRKEDLVTASVVGALFDRHPWTTALKLYVAARGIEFDDVENKLMRRGRLLEAAVPGAVMEERPHWHIEPANCYLRCPDLRLGATPDFFIHDDSPRLGVLQAKTTSLKNFEREWLNGESIPAWIEDQTLTEALLAQAEFAAVAVLIVERYELQCIIIDVPVERERQDLIVEAVTRFRDDVIAGREPQPDFFRDAAAIAALTRKEIPGKVCDLSGNNAVPDLLARRAALIERIKRDDAERKSIETEMRFLLGDAERADGVPGWRVTYKIEPRRGYTVEPSEPRVLRILGE